jgi:hypothetical protein
MQRIVFERALIGYKDMILDPYSGLGILLVCFTIAIWGTGWISGDIEFFDDEKGE